MRDPWGRGGARRRLGALRYPIEDAAYGIRRGLAGLGRRLASAWRGAGPWARRTVAAVTVAVPVAAALVWVSVHDHASCGPGGDPCRSGDDTAAEIVPGDALGYLHLSADPDSEQLELATELAERLPTLTDDALGALQGATGLSFDFERQVEPWFGGQAALALLPGRGRLTERLVLLEAADAAGAERFAERVVGASPEVAQHRGVEVRSAGDGSAAALAGGFLLLGRAPQVRAAIDAATGEAPALADTEGANRVRNQLPEGRLLDGYLSPDGAEEVLSDGPLAFLETLVNPGATEGAAAALVATEDGLELAIRSDLDPERAGASPGFFAALEPFEPSLDEAVGEDALAYLGLGNPAESVGELLAQAATSAPGILTGFEDLERQLRNRDGVDLSGELLPLLGSEAALAIEPPAGDAVGIPFLSLIAEEVDGDDASEALARLQGPVAKALAGDGAGAPAFEAEEVDGVTVQSLRLSPIVNLSYAVLDDRLVIATDPAGVERAREGGEGLERSEAFERATEGFPERLSTLAYLELSGLVDLAERAGLAEEPAYARIAEDVRALDALGLAVEGRGASLRTDARLIVGEALAADEAPPAGAPEAEPEAPAEPPPVDPLEGDELPGELLPGNPLQPGPGQAGPPGR